MYLFISSKRTYIFIALILVALNCFTQGVEYISTSLIVIIIGILCILPEVLYSKKSKEDLWAKWDTCHTAKKQQDRIERALVYNELIPVKIDVESRCAKFAGQSSKERYRTTLRSCSSPDFKKRKLPCKHMYYLANQCDIEIPR
ncbi:MAG: hypothetical protein NC231_10975 [Bacillus sp. (in: Bacteria)]|nr:hypothetical protein [Bacillus sp. (in: firmicutes)]MCM1427327.1 hypothetical protein [Eubacterium sp.]